MPEARPRLPSPPSRGKIQGPDWRRRFLSAFPGARLDEPLSRHTTFRIGGPADAYLTVRALKDLKRVVRFGRREKVPVFPLGLGSKLLVLDGGLRGIAVRLGEDFSRLRFARGAIVRAGAGVSLWSLVRRCARRGLRGAEALAGIPGTVGGALVMNAGTAEGEIGALVRSVDILDAKALRKRTLTRTRLRFAYRSSNLAGRVVLGCVLELQRGDKVDIIERVDKFQGKRLRTQPVRSFTVGSIFKNPPGQFAAKLIQDAGLKGRSCGGARISRLHANFIENFNRAKASDVLRLVETAREKVLRRAGVRLELEMRVIGEKTSHQA